MKKSVSPRTPSRTDGAQAIRRSLNVVRVVAQIQRSGATLSRVARATGLNTSTAFRILRSLTEERMLRYSENEQSYYVGPLAFELGLAASGEAQIQTSWRDTIEHIARQTRLTTHLVARSDNEGALLICVHGSTALRAVPAEVGQRVPLGMGSASLALLAALEDDEIDSVIASLGPRLDLYPGGTGKPDRILKRVQLTRRRGYAVVDGILSPGITGIGIAVPQKRGPLERNTTQLAVSVAGVSSTLNPKAVEKLAAVVLAAVRSHTVSPREAHLTGVP
jgi:DNA-binding IclR family transcriptional regulator